MPQYGSELALYNADVITVQQTWFSGLVIAMITSLATVAGAAFYMGGRRVRAIAQAPAQDTPQDDETRVVNPQRPLALPGSAENPLAIVPARPQPRLVFGDWLINYLRRVGPNVNPTIDEQAETTLAERDITIVRVKDSLMARLIGGYLSRFYGDGDEILVNGRRYVIILESRQAGENVGTNNPRALTPGRYRVNVPADNIPEEVDGRAPLIDVNLPTPPLAIEGRQPTPREQVNPNFADWLEHVRDNVVDPEGNDGRETPRVPPEAGMMEPITLPPVGENHGVIDRNPHANMQRVNVRRRNFWERVGSRLQNMVRTVEQTANTVNPTRVERAAGLVPQPQRSSTPTDFTSGQATYNY